MLAADKSAPQPEEDFAATPSAALPPFTLRFATSMTVRISQQCIFLPSCKPLICPDFDSLH